MNTSTMSIVLWVAAGVILLMLISRRRQRKSKDF